MIGIVLTGLLDDGTAGLQAVKRCGGVAIVQDPEEAPFPDMPKNALANVQIDHCLPIVEMPGLLERLVRESVAASAAAPSDLEKERASPKRASAMRRSPRSWAP